MLRKNEMLNFIFFSSYLLKPSELVSISIRGWAPKTSSSRTSTTKTSTSKTSTVRNINCQKRRLSISSSFNKINIDHHQPEMFIIFLWFKKWIMKSEKLQKDRQIKRHTKGQTDRQTDGRTDKLMYEWKKSN